MELTITTYCELKESFYAGAGLPKYVVYSGAEAWYKKGLYGYNYMSSSERAWVQYENGTVKWVKNRFVDPETAPVDMKEFMFVKLASVPV